MKGTIKKKLNTKETNVAKRYIDIELFKNLKNSGKENYSRDDKRPDGKNKHGSRRYILSKSNIRSNFGINGISSFFNCGIDGLNRKPKSNENEYGQKFTLRNVEIYSPNDCKQ